MLLLRRSLAISLVIFLASICLAQHGGGGGGGHSGGAPAGTGNNFGTSSPSTQNQPSVSPALAEDEGKIEFHAESILIQVPVVVTDKNGVHIHGLTKEQFQVAENGKDQKVSTFEEVTTTNTKLPALEAKPGEFRNLTLSEQEPRTVTVIALDTVNTPFLDQAYGRRELVKYLANTIDSSQVMALMIITSHGLKVVQGLTGDPVQLVQILKKVSGELQTVNGISVDSQADAATGDLPSAASTMPALVDPVVAMANFVERGDAIYGQFGQAEAIEQTLNGFLGIAWTLSGIPGRKSVIWATGGFPFDITSPSNVPGGYLSTLYERTMGALVQSQISVYPVDVRGLVNSAASDITHGGTVSQRQTTNRSWALQSTIDSLDEFASMTGGKAYYNTNDLATSFKRASDDASSYYLLGYYLDLKNNHAGWRQLKVKVDRGDAEVRARKGFFVTNATVHTDVTRRSDVTYALQSPIEGTGVPVTVKWLGINGDSNKKKALFSVHLPPDGLSIEGSPQNHLNFDIAVAAFTDKDKQGEPALTWGQTVTTPVPDDQMAVLRAHGIGVKNALELAPGQYTVRFVVRDNVTGRVGSVTAPLTVN